MPFVNEIISDEDKKTVDFSRFALGNFSCDVSSPTKTWTIDRERAVFLIGQSYGVRRDPDDDDTFIFILHWQHDFARAAVNKVWTKDHIHWKGWIYLATAQMENAQIWSDLAKEALTTYGAWGSVINPQRLDDRTIQVELRIQPNQP